MRCTACNNEISEKMVTCPVCGSALKPEDQTIERCGFDANQDPLMNADYLKVVRTQVKGFHVEVELQAQNGSKLGSAMMTVNFASSVNVEVRGSNDDILLTVIPWSSSALAAAQIMKNDAGDTIAELGYLKKHNDTRRFNVFLDGVEKFSIGEERIASHFTLRDLQQNLIIDARRTKKFFKWPWTDINLKYPEGVDRRILLGSILTFDAKLSLQI